MARRCHGKGFSRVQPAGGLQKAGRLGAHAPPPVGRGSSLVHKAKDLVGTGAELNSAKS